MSRTTYPEKYFDFDGIKIRYIDIGHGKPLVFLHGLGSYIEGYSPIYPYLEQNYRIISMDQPGSGFSDKPEKKYSVNYLVDFILEFTEHLSIKTFNVAGGSQGGLLALLCCAAAPERIEKAIVYSAAGVWQPQPVVAAFFRRLPPEAVSTFFWFTSFFWHSPFHPDYWKYRKSSMEYNIQNAKSPGFGLHVLGCVASQFEHNYIERFKQIKNPALIFWGTHDFGMPVWQGRRLHKLVKNSQYLEVAGAGHDIFSEEPAFCAEKIIKFLGSD